MENASTSNETKSFNKPKVRKVVEISTATSENEIIDPRELSREDLYAYAMDHAGVVQKATFKPKSSAIQWKQDGWALRWLIDHDSQYGFQLVMFAQETGAKAVAKRGKWNLFKKEGFTENDFEKIYRMRGIPDMFSLAVLRPVAAIINHPMYDTLKVALKNYEENVASKRESFTSWKKAYMRFFDGIRIEDRKLVSIAKIINGMNETPEDKPMSEDVMKNMLGGGDFKVVPKKKKEKVVQEVPVVDETPELSEELSDNALAEEELSA